MKKVNHISFDFWNCIATPNSEFNTERINFFAKFLDSDKQKIVDIYNKEKDRFDVFAEQYGRQISVDEAYYSFLCNIFAFPPKELVSKIRQNIEELFIKYPPFISVNTINAIRDLQKTGVTTNIGSNTNYISGHILRRYVLERYRLNFNSYVFSDELGVPKPHKAFFDKVFQESKQKDVDKIVHIGDTHATDYVGAINYGMQAVLINGPIDLAPAIYKIIKENES